MENKNESGYSHLFGKLSIRNYGREFSLFLLFAVINFAFGCTYYKVTTPKDITMLEKEISSNSKLFIVHQGDKVWRLKNVELHDEQKTLSGKFETLAPENYHYLKTNENGNTRYTPQNTNTNPTYQVHFYILEYAQDENENVTIPLSAVKKIEMYDKATGATTASYVFGTIGILAAVFVVVSVVALLLKSSCPFVYIKEGNVYTFTGEMYGGAIYSSLERDDYMPLPYTFHSNGEYELKISNELLERQYTNLAELIVVEHPENANAILDKNGMVQTVHNPESPIRASSEKAGDYLETVSRIDSNQYLFNDENKDNPDASNLTLTFHKPRNVTSGKLILNLKNSYWLDYVYGKFNEQFGTYFNEFAGKQKNVSAEKMNQWSLDQSIPLSVYVQSATGWEYVDYFQVIGPLVSRDVVMALDLSHVKSDQVMIRLESGFMFWEIDYAAMDFSENIPTSTSNFSATTAIDETGRDISKNIAASDKLYLVQPDIGNEAFVKFNVPGSKESNRQSFFLHSKGYYEYIRNYQNKPDYIMLSSFKRKGSFTEFSREQYSTFVGDSYFFESNLTTTDGK